MKRIMCLIKTLNVGGAEHVLVDISNYLVSKGYDVTIQTILDEGRYRDVLDSRVKYQPGFRSRSFFWQRAYLRILMTLPRGILGNVLIGKNYTHIVAFTEGLPTKIIGGNLQNSVKKLAWVHTDLFANYESGKIFGSEKKNKDCYDCFDHVICVSNDAKRGYEKRIGQHRSIFVQYNPLNKSEIIERSKAKSEYKLETDETINIAALGRIEKIKGFDLLVEAVSIAGKHVNKPVKLYIIGGGSEEEALKQQIIKHGLGDVVYLCGQQTNPYSIMSKCDMQVIPSRAEGYSLALCEGHFLGLPVVATKCSGPMEILTASKGGILVDISAEAIADGIVQMVNDEALFADCKKNVAEWSDNYDVDAVYRQIEAIFD